MNSTDIPFEQKAPTLLQESQQLNLTLTRLGQANLHTGNKVQILLNGEETYKDWLEAISKAKKWIHLENYIIQDDKVGQKFSEALISKSKEGVKVRVLYDWFGCIRTPKSFWNKMRKNGIEVRSVSPFKILSPMKVVQRDHRKFLGVDGTYVSTGGVCIGEQWLEISPVTNLPFRDTAVRIEGPAIVDLEEAFASLWAEVGEGLPTEERMSELSFPERHGNYAVRVITEEPGKMMISKMIDFTIAGAQKKIWIADAYFLAVPSLYQSLLNAAQDGVDVRILLPATNDIPWIAFLSRSGYRQLLEAGVRIWEYSGLMMHSKTTVIDGWWSRVGSTNLNVSSFLLNWELDLIIEDREFGAQMEKIYEEDLKNAREICLDKSPKKKVYAERPMSEKERIAKEKVSSARVGGSGFRSAAARAGTAALKSGGRALKQHEKKVSGVIAVICLIFAALFFFFPRALAWPIAFIFLVLAIVGATRVLQPIKDID